jgi:GT2 family glycosyltransferase
MLNVFVSIINFNGEKDTLECLKSLKSVNIENFKLSVVVIDNASDKRFTIGKDKFAFNLKIIRSEENLGFSGGQNLGIKYSLKNKADYVIVMNNDVYLDNNFIVNLLETFKEKKDCGLASPKIYFAKGYEYHKDRYAKDNLGKIIWYAGGEIDWKNVIAFHKGVDEVDNGQFDKVEKTDFASGCCVMIKKEVFEKIGFFDEKYFLYYEDNDFSQRAKKHHFYSYIQPNSIIWHKNAGSAGGPGSSLQDYYISRNRMLFGFRYAPMKSKLALVKESFKIIFSDRFWQKRGVIDFYLGRFGKGSFIK